ncbi:MAG: hypothetical protein ACLFXM_01000 [Acidimicrobiia bacterium]
MPRVGSTRRTLGGLCLVVAAVFAMVLGGPAAAQQETEGLIPPGDWTDEQIEYMLDLIEKTEQVLPDTFPTLATYEELEQELGDLGYFEFGATAPGGYDHWINPGYMFDDHLIEPEFSESLVYQAQPDGRWKLVSAMFMLSPNDTIDDIPEDIAWLPGWHVHPELCVGPDGTFAGITDPDDPDCPPGSSQALGSPMMHVWIVENDCDHRFGGVGVSGLHCDVTHDHGDDHDDMDMDDDMDDDDEPAEPVVSEPSFTG